eukprot:TRINITY_DN21333_c0_g1_i1.p1 TRINITY_DN21333_c0_g1~~TRINITY_DN21333_c0_g1_i1.p1  ORF type:complete len:582 (-),score=211.49 TRINITY_DN21333_c0_g1_i1:212-1852(-)
MSGAFVVLALAVELTCARVLVPERPATPAGDAGPSTLELSGILDKAVLLMEKGTEKLVKDAQIHEARLSSSTGEAASEAQTTVTSLGKILKDFRSLHLIAQKLHGRYSTEVQQLKAAADDKGSLLTVAQSRTKALERDNADLQRMLKDEMKNTEHCATELRIAQNQTCDAVREKDAKTIHELQDEKAKLSKELNAAKAALQNASDSLQTRNDELSADLMLKSKENDDLKAQLQALTARLATDENNEGILNATLQDEREKLAMSKDQEEDVQEERDTAEETAKEMKTTNLNLQSEIAARQEDLAAVQKQLDAANSDKSRLLDSVRMLMHQNDDYQRKLVALHITGDVTAPAAPSSSQLPEVSNADLEALTFDPVPDVKDVVVAAGVNASASGQGNATTNSSSTSSKAPKWDSIVWMDKTRKIDEYLSRLSPEDHVEALAAPEPPQTPAAPMLTDYLGIKKGELKLKAADTKAPQSAGPAKTEKPAAPIARYLRSTAAASATTASAPSAFAKVPGDDEEAQEEASKKDIQEANVLYSEAEKLIASSEN